MRRLLRKPRNSELALESELMGRVSGQGLMARGSLGLFPSLYLSSQPCWPHKGVSQQGKEARLGSEPVEGMLASESSKYQSLEKSEGPGPVLAQGGQQEGQPLGLLAEDLSETLVPIALDLRKEREMESEKSENGPCLRLQKGRRVRKGKRSEGDLGKNKRSEEDYNDGCSYARENVREKQKQSEESQKLQEHKEHLRMSLRDLLGGECRCGERWSSGQGEACGTVDYVYQVSFPNAIIICCITLFVY